MENESSFQNPFRTLKIKWQPEGADEASSLEMCLGDVLFATVDKLIEMTRLLKCMSTETTTHEEKCTCAALAEEVHQQEMVVAKCLLSSAVAAELTNDVIRFPYRLERIGDMLERILSCFEKKAKDGIQFSAEAQAELELLFTALLEIMEDLGKAFAASDAVVSSPSWYVVTRATNRTSFVKGWRGVACSTLVDTVPGWISNASSSGWRSSASRRTARARSGSGRRAALPDTTR